MDDRCDVCEDEETNPLLSDFDSKEETIVEPKLFIAEETASIIVTNISIETTHKQLGDFFSFCGNITALSVTPGSDESTNTAIVTYSSPAAARTSVLLNLAEINERQIKVTLAPTDYQLPKTQQVCEPEPDFSLDNLITHELPAEQRTQTSVIASLLAKGYQLSSDAFQKAKTFDQTYTISKQMDQKWSDFAVAVNHYDSVYRISEKGEKLKETVSDKCKQVNDQYAGGVQRIGVQLNLFADGASKTMQTGFEFAAGAITNFIQKNPSVQLHIESWKTASNSAYNQVATALSRS